MAESPTGMYVCVCVSHVGHQRHCGHKVHNNKANK